MSGTRSRSQPVGGHRRPTPETKAYGKVAPPRGKQHEMLFVPGLTDEAAAVIAGALALSDVEPDLAKWSLPNRPRLNSRKDVSAGLERRPSPAERVRWLVAQPYISRAMLASVTHAK